MINDVGMCEYEENMPQRLCLHVDKVSYITDVVFDAIVLWNFHHLVISPGMANQWWSRSMKTTEESEDKHLQV